MNSLRNMVRRSITRVTTAGRRSWKFLRLPPKEIRAYFRLKSATGTTPIPPFPQLRSLRIASILDEFSFESFGPEATFLQIEPAGWREDLERFSPQLILVESAWRGKNGSWYKKVSEISPELIDVLTFARQRAIPTVFWHKEVPPHFRTFLKVSRMFDFVFLTDADCIPAYRKELGHERVFFLPFACQPRIHHPIGGGARERKILFAGTFYPEYKYPERYRNFLDLFDTLHPLIPIDIFDRVSGKGPYSFPERFHPFILGSLPFSELCRVYRTYEYGLNLNSVKRSESMCARRVFELIASNTFVIGNESTAVKRWFGDLTICSDSPDEIRERFRAIDADPSKREKIKRIALRNVLSRHTYGHRLQTILKTLEPSFHPRTGRIDVAAFCRSAEEEARIRAGFDRQTHAAKTLTIFRAGEEPLFPGWMDRPERGEFLALFEPDRHYGPNYLLDLSLGFLFGESRAITKRSHFTKEGGRLSVARPGDEYRVVPSFVPAESLVRMECGRSLFQDGILPLEVHQEALSIDRFNLLKLSGDLPSDADRMEVEDLSGVNEGEA